LDSACCERPTRAQLVRDHLTLEIRPVRSLLSGVRE